MKKAMTEEEKLLAQFNSVADAIEFQLVNNEWGKLKEPVMYICSRGRTIYTSIREAAEAKATPHAKAYPATYFYGADEDTGEIYIDEKIKYNVAAEWVFIRAKR